MTNVNIVSYLERQGISLIKEGKNYQAKSCPFCDHKDCFKVNNQENFFHCFSCGKAGDAAKYESIISGISYHEAANKLSGQNNEPTQTSSAEVSLGNLLIKNHLFLLENVLYQEWLINERKFTLDAIKKFKIGCFISKDEKIIFTFPYHSKGKVINVKYRTANKTIVCFKSGCETILYNIDAVKNSETVLIVEGEPDTVAAYCYNLNLPAIGVGTGAKGFKDTWHKDLSHLKTIYICLDMDETGQEGARKLAYKLGISRTKIVSIPFKDLNDCLINGISADEIEKCIYNAKSLFQIEIIEAIESIPVEEKLIGNRINEEVLPLIAKRPKAEIEDYLRFMRERWPEVSYKQSRDWRNIIDHLRYESFESSKIPIKSTEIIISEKDKLEAMALLQNKDILKIIQKYLDTLGIVGEDENKIALWLFMLSRKLEKQIHAIVFGQSSSGKSELVKKVLSTVPEEDVMEYSSMTARSLEYRSENDLIGKVISIAEYAGIEEVEYIIRTAQSEGKINRAYTIRDDETGELKNAENQIKCQSVFIITTTKSFINNENNTRVFSLYTNESLSQTQKVCYFIKYQQSREWKKKSPEREKVINILKTAQRLLKPVDVVINWAGLLEFPECTTRNRRDLTRFINFIQVIAFLRQYQKEIKNDEIGQYIEADIYDYKLAYEHLLPILRNTLDELSPRSLKVLEICCLLQEDLIEKSLGSADEGFTIKMVQKKANDIGVDLKNSTNLRNELFELCESEYLELVTGTWGLRGSRQYFNVVCMYEVNNVEGIVSNIRNKKLHVLSPEELENLTKLQ